MTVDGTNKKTLDETTATPRSAHKYTEAPSTGVIKTTDIATRATGCVRLHGVAILKRLKLTETQQDREMTCKELITRLAKCNVHGTSRPSSRITDITIGRKQRTRYAQYNAQLLLRPHSYLRKGLPATRHTSSPCRTRPTSCMSEEYVPLDNWSVDDNMAPPPSPLMLPTTLYKEPPILGGVSLLMDNL